MRPGAVVVFPGGMLLVLWLLLAVTDLAVFLYFVDFYGTCMFYTGRICSRKCKASDCCLSIRPFVFPVFFATSCLMRAAYWILIWCVRLDRDPAHSAHGFGQQVASLVFWFGLDDWMID